MKIFYLFLLLFNISFAQQSTIDSIIKIEIKILKENNIKEFYFLEEYCVGNDKILENEEVSCLFKNSKVYVFWKENKECFFKTIDKCDSITKKISGEPLKNYKKK